VCEPSVCDGVGQLRAAVLSVLQVQGSVVAGAVVPETADLKGGKSSIAGPDHLLVSHVLVSVCDLAADSEHHFLIVSSDCSPAAASRSFSFCDLNIPTITHLNIPTITPATAFTDSFRLDSEISLLGKRTAFRGSD
jgi:hypothetical protein